MREDPAALLLRSYRRPPEGVLEAMRAMRGKIVLALTLVFGVDTVRVCLPVAQPSLDVARDKLCIVASPRGGTPEPRPSPDPAMDLEALFARLESVQDVQEFLLSSTAYRPPDGAVEFLWAYRQEPRNFQANAWRGPCNNFAEFAGTWAVLRGGVPYVVSLCPGGILEKVQRNWHQFIVCKRTDGKIVVFDNQSVCVLEESLEAYIAREHPALEIAPFGGIIRWMKVRNDPRAKLLQHVFSPSLSSSEQMEEADVPLTPGEEDALQHSTIT